MKLYDMQSTKEMWKLNSSFHEFEPTYIDFGLFMAYQENNKTKLWQVGLQMKAVP